MSLYTHILTKLVSVNLIFLRTKDPLVWHKSMIRRRNLWVGWCFSSWWPLFPSKSSMLMHIYIHIYRYIYICICALLYELCFLWFTNCVLLSDNSLIRGCLWRLVFVLNNTLILGISCSTIPHLPGCFCLWTFFQNIRFNIGYSAGDFQALQLIVLATFGAVD